MQPNQPPAPPQDLTGYFNDPRLAQAQTDYNAAQGQANTESASAISLPTELRNALAAKFGENNPLVQQREGNLKDYLNSIPSSYNDVLPENNHGVVLSPTQQAMMIGAKQNAYLAPLATSNYLLGLQTGGIQNIIDSASAAQKARAETAQGKAQLAHQNYADTLNLLSAQADQAYKQRTLAQEKQLREQELGLQSQRFAFDIQGGMKGLAQRQLTEDLKQGGKTGLSLRDALQRYGNQLSPDEIYGIYNTSSGRGPAKENSAQLSNLGIKPTDSSKMQDAFETTTGTINNLLDQYKQVKTNPILGNLLARTPLTAQNNYEKQRLALAVALKDISGAGAGSGVRVTQAELNNWAKLLPSAMNTDSVNKSNIISLDKNLKAKFHGQGLSQQYLQQFGIGTGGNNKQSQGSWEVVSP